MYSLYNSNAFHALHILGIFFVLPCIETYQKVDLRTITLDVPPQEVALHSRTLHSSNYSSAGSNSRLGHCLSGRVVYYRVSNATISVANVENAHHSTR